MPAFHLLGAAFAACMLKNLALACALLDFAYTDAEVDVVLHRQDTPPKLTEITCEFPPDRRGIDNEDRDAREAEEVRPGVP